MQAARQQYKATSQTHAIPEMLRTRQGVPQQAHRGNSYTGNQAALRRLSHTTPRVQCKLEIGAVNDPLEAEADHVAEQVMRMSDPALSIDAAPLQISRKCAACEKEAEDKEELQMKSAGATQTRTGEAPDIVHTVIRSPGQPLDAASRAYFEPRFGHDFSGVRVHSDSHAAESAASIGASAYTAGSNIAFAEGRYSPATSSGRRLLAHELTHVVQQRALSPSGAISGAPLIQRDLNSDFYKQGYQDGLAGKEAQPALVWDEAALDDYNAGYAKGHSDISQQSASPAAPAPAASGTPVPAQFEQAPGRGPSAPATQQANPDSSTNSGMIGATSQPSNDGQTGPSCSCTPRKVAGVVSNFWGIDPQTLAALKGSVPCGAMGGFDVWIDQACNVTYVQMRKSGSGESPVPYNAPGAIHDCNDNMISGCVESSTDEKSCIDCCANVFQDDTCNKNCQMGCSTKLGPALPPDDAPLPDDILNQP